MTVNMTAVALLAAPAAVAYSSMNWMAFHEFDKQIEFEKQRAFETRKVVIGSKGLDETREQALDAISDARDAIRKATWQARRPGAGSEVTRPTDQPSGR